MGSYTPLPSFNPTFNDVTISGDLAVTGNASANSLSLVGALASSGVFVNGAQVYAPSTLPRTFPTGEFANIQVGGTFSTFSLTDGVLMGMPIDCEEPVSVDQVLAEIITTAGGAGSVMRFGFYTDDGTLNDTDALIADLGTVATTATGIKIVTFAPVILPIGRSWIVSVGQGAPAPNPTVRSAIGSSPLPYTTSPIIVPEFKAVAGVLGALPASISLTGVLSQVAALYVRKA